MPAPRPTYTVLPPWTGEDEAGVGYSAIICAKVGSAKCQCQNCGDEFESATKLARYCYKRACQRVRLGKRLERHADYHREKMARKLQTK